MCGEYVTKLNIAAMVTIYLFFFDDKMKGNQIGFVSLISTFQFVNFDAHHFGCDLLNGLNV